MIESKGKRARRKRIKVVFPDGKNFCFANVTDTFISTLREIGSDRFPEIALEISHLPILSKEIYPKYRDYMKKVCDGWYVNTQSNTDQKYLQLRSISDSLGLNLAIDIGEELETQENPEKEKKKRSVDKLLVKFPDGEYIGCETSLEGFLQCLWKIGLERILQRRIEWLGRELITRYQDAPDRIKVGENLWVLIPTGTKDRARTLKVIDAHLHLGLEITII